MANCSEKKETTLSWAKPPGPPKVWSVVDSLKKDEQGRSFEFTIQEIPEDRYEDVLDHMCRYFIADEALCDSQNGKDDPEYIANFRALWADIAKQGLSIAAFVDNPDGGKPIIAGVNMLGVDCKGSSHTADDLKLTSKKAEHVMRVILHLSDQAQIYDTYKVDKYLFALGLSVHPSYRGQALGGHILKAREKIGKEYKIPVTSTVFTSPIAQKLAERCGFEVLVERDYADIKDEDGNPAFPNIKTKTLKIMARRLY